MSEGFILKESFMLCRTAIPFLAYPSTYYSEITSSSYNWIPASFSQNDSIQLKLAKYSPTGQYLGLFDAFDAYMQLCGGAYTDGQAAFTFGTQFAQTVGEKMITGKRSSYFSGFIHSIYKRQGVCVREVCALEILLIREF